MKPPRSIRRSHVRWVAGANGLRFGVVGVLLACWLVSPALACICSKPPSRHKALERAKAVFEAQVLDVRDDAWGYGFVELQVRRAWKGLEPGTRELLVYAPDGEACGFHFEEGTTYLVYAHEAQPRNWVSAFGAPGGPEGYLLVSSCSRTEPLERAVADLVRLGEPRWTLGNNAPP